MTHHRFHLLGPLAVIIIGLLGSLPARGGVESTPKWTRQNLLTVAWSPTVPAGRALAQVPGVSYGGGTVGYRIRFNSQSLGVRGFRNSHSGHRDRPSDIIDITHTELSSNWHYYTVTPKNMMPFAGVGAGGIRRTQRSIGQHSVYTSRQWHVSLYPEIGMILFLEKIPVLLSAGVHIMLKRHTRPAYLTVFQLGLALPH